jgi:hypothetical protein
MNRNFYPSEFAFMQIGLNRLNGMMRYRFPLVRI